MSNKLLILGSSIALLIATTFYEDHSSQNLPANRIISPARVWAAPNCPYGLEPGDGPMHCADPNDPNSYLYKKNQQQTQPKPAQPAKPQTKKADVYSIDNPPKGDNLWCREHAKSAGELERCWRIQHPIPAPKPNPHPLMG